MCRSEDCRKCSWLFAPDIPQALSICRGVVNSKVQANHPYSFPDFPDSGPSGFIGMPTEISHKRIELLHALWLVAHTNFRGSLTDGTTASKLNKLIKEYVPAHSPSLPVGRNTTSCEGLCGRVHHSSTTTQLHDYISSDMLQYQEWTRRVSRQKPSHIVA